MSFPSPITPIFFKWSSIKSSVTPPVKSWRPWNVRPPIRAPYDPFILIQRKGSMYLHSYSQHLLNYFHGLNTTLQMLSPTVEPKIHSLPAKSRMQVFRLLCKEAGHQQQRQSNAQIARTLILEYTHFSYLYKCGWNYFTRTYNAMQYSKVWPKVNDAIIILVQIDIAGNSEVEKILIQSKIRRSG